jgi:tetratricopeptide (TPR) repeat protein
MVNLAYVYERAGQIDMARAGYEATIATGHPEQAPKAMMSLGLLLEQLGDRDGALHAYERVVRFGHPDWTDRVMPRLRAVRGQV